MPNRPPKKTETIEIRLSPELKSALGRFSEGQGHSMSEMVRGLIERGIAGPLPIPNSGDPTMTRFIPRRVVRSTAFAIPVLVLAALYLVTAQSPATASEEARVFFAELDSNGDGGVSQTELESFLQADGWEPDADCGNDGADPCALTEVAAFYLDIVDSDRDGIADFEEVSALVMRERAEAFLDMDVDENGFLSMDEIVLGEIAWMIEAPEEAAEEGYVLAQACLDQVRDETLAQLAATCGFEADARVEMAVYDTSRDGRVSLEEYLDH